MGKFGDDKPGFRDARFEPPKTCAQCDWDFKRDNERKVYYDPTNPRRWRFEPRGAVAVTRTRTLCDTCYEKLLFKNGEHYAIGTPMEQVVRDSLWPDGKPRQKVTREKALTEINRLCDSLAADPPEEAS